MKETCVYFVLPCYNEEECLLRTYSSLNKKFEKLLSKKEISGDSRILFVDDGSKDNTWTLIKKLGMEHENVVGLKLAHNVGHQNALLAGLIYAANYADATISMDADLQDNLSVIDGFIKKYNEDYEVVYGVRGDRKSDTGFKRFTAQSFYKMMKMMGVDLVYNAADCRLMSKRAVKQLGKYPEVNLFLRGIVPLIGLKSTTTEYTRDERIAGESKYPLKKMLNFAWDGITSFSVKPIRLITTIGMLIFILTLLVTTCILVMRLIGSMISGWVFVICAVWLATGIQMISIGVIGEYIGKSYAETKRRPRYFIERIIREGEDKRDE